MKHIRKFNDRRKLTEAKVQESSFGEICFLVAVLVYGSVEGSYSKAFFDMGQAKQYFLKQIRKRLGMEFTDYKEAKRYLREHPHPKYRVDISEIDLLK